MQAHSVANLFPMMTPEDYAELKADIQSHGLREPVWVHDGQIIDGRNRYKACEELGIQPAIRQYTGDSSMSDLVAFVVSANLKRRHLRSSQRAIVALDIESMLAEDAEQRKRERCRDAAIRQHHGRGFRNYFRNPSNHPKTPRSMRHANRQQPLPAPIAVTSPTQSVSNAMPRR